VSKKSDVAVETPYRIKLVITIFANLEKFSLNINNDTIERISIMRHAIPKIFIMIKQVIKTLDQIANLIINLERIAHLSLPILLFFLCNL
jgi:hypothetical protein